MIIRPARPDEIPALERLIAASARQLSIGFYSPQETEAAIKHVFGVDSELVGDGTYLVVELDGRIAGCGGWSRRATLFGSDRFAQRQIGFVDPAQAPAKIRAFFIAPEFARRGVGAALLDACEAAARAADFTQAELMATLPGVPFYTAYGYRAQGEVVQHYDGIPLRFVPMRKTLFQPSQQEAAPETEVQT
ncbi:MAG: GNAT family N-acetyltransferase [Sphingomonadales bacterium RIFCSPHIGHO2_01_FULL_65_20]|jgi:GNAT superfamily N-acetyltransferase|uniref:GNAT family N-acetyltransferase n=1 Tax=unclassified Blastomonas TaxID=2626550 RepID=UPI00082BC87C|nr:GNAT family N-acetyltransferase [Blastomonas sp.]MCH2239514.1 GNAT family N-acetyltransferase [Blastomonas sp.]OHC95417.1 MAG: GNAT family N-acetyltransferase [Sphingomonadales bacterium RIFCSPHIGHO2_01_FULL_65_20]